MTPFTEQALVLTGALLWDALLGEPPKFCHPVVWIGRLQRTLRRSAPRRPASAFLHGLGMALLGPALFGGGSWLLLRGLEPWPVARILVSIYLLKSAFAVRSLAEAAVAVATALRANDLVSARGALRSLVSRPTAVLDSPRVAAAAIESVAENTSDSLVAPLVYFLIAGVPGALAYRAINTLDALIGYHGETEWLGKAAARLDDLANWLPARLTAALLVAVAAAADASPRRALAIWWRDGGTTESPNAGRPMAAMAGALGVELEKIDHYRLGAGLEVADARTIDRAVRLLWLVGGLTTTLVFALLKVGHGS